MPTRDGYQVCESLRALKQFVDVPIILYSRQDTDEFAARGRRAGATLCLRKSSKSSELLDRIEEIFTQKSHQKQAIETHLSNEIVGDPFDFTELQMETAMHNTGGDASLLAELVGVFREETPAIMEQLRIAIDPLDESALQHAAHRLGGSLAIIGATQAADLAARLENFRHDKNFDSIKEIHAELIARTETLMSELERYTQAESARPPSSPSVKSLVT